MVDEKSMEKINAMSLVLSAVKDCFIQDRVIKDEIINIAAGILQKELKNMVNSL